MSELNETYGRSNPHEPSPIVVDMVFCVWQNKRITLHDAQGIYQPHSADCKCCMSCQGVSS